MITQDFKQQTRVDLAQVIEEGRQRHFYFRQVSRNAYASNVLFTPVDYCNLNHDERKRVAVLDYCGVPIKRFLRGEEVTELQQIVLPRIHLPWKIIAGAAGAVLALVLLAPLLMTIVTGLGVILLASAVTLIDPVTIALLDDGTPEGQWLELMFYHEPPAFCIRLAPKREGQ